MWRALFLAIGIMLIIVGVECTVVGRFTISQEANLPPAIEKMLAGEGWAGSTFASPAPNNSGAAGLAAPHYASNVAPPQPIPPNQGYGGMPTVSSQHGPSRFSGNQLGNDQFSNSQFSLAGFGTRSAPAPVAVPVQNRSGMLRLVQTKDWMPWSLIAAGTIIVLYTKSVGRSDFGSGG
jgi:hypothetical protein